MNYQDLLRVSSGKADKAHDLVRRALLPSTSLPNRVDCRRAREALQDSPPDAIPGWLYSVRARVLKRWGTRAAHEGIPRAKRLTGPRLAAWRTQRSGKASFAA